MFFVHANDYSLNSSILNPVWPPRPSLFGCPDYLKGVDFNKQSQWCVDEWRAYARYLEERGAELVKELSRKEVELRHAKQKAGRRTTPVKHRKGTLLTGYEAAPQSRRGRKLGSGNDAIAVAVIERQKLIKSQGRRVSIQEIAFSILVDSGLSGHKARPLSKTIANRAVKLKAKFQ